jgi:hypothetical protein
MNCDELAAVLEKTLLHERDSRWIHEARNHAEGCPVCVRLLALHHVEERLTELPGVEPSSMLLEAVMSRLAHREVVAVPASQGFSFELLRYAMISAGALLLAAAYLIPAGGRSWFSDLWSPPGLVGTFGVSTYLGQHPFWAINLAGFAALLIVLGLAVSEAPVPENA